MNRPIIFFDKISPWQFFQIVRFGSLLATNILFTKGLLNTTEIGLYEAILLIGTASSAFWVTGIMQGLLAVFPRNQKTPALFNVFLLLFAISILTSLILLLCAVPITSLLSISDTSLFYDIFPWYILFLLFNNVTYLNEYFFMMTNRSISLLRYGIISYGLQFLLLVAPLLFHFELIQSMQALAVLGVLKFVFTLHTIWKHAIWKIETSYIKLLFHKSWPLALATMVSGYAYYIDGWMIKHFFDEKTFAAFIYGAREFPISLIMAGALSETLANSVRKDGIDFTLTIIKEQSRRLSFLLFPITCILIIVVPALFPIVFNKDFSSSASIFNIYLLMLIPRLLFPQSILLGLGKNRIILLSAAIEICINVIASIILIQLIGWEGAAWGTLIASISDKLFLWYYVTKRLSLPFASITHLRAWLIGSVMLICFYLTFLLAAPFLFK